MFEFSTSGCRATIQKKNVVDMINNGTIYRGNSKPRDKFGRDPIFHGYVWDGTRKSRDLSKFHGTRVCTRDAVIAFFARDGIGIANSCAGLVYKRDPGIIPYPAESRGIVTTIKIPRKAIIIATINIIPGTWYVPDTWYRIPTYVSTYRWYWHDAYLAPISYV